LFPSNFTKLLDFIGQVRALHDYAATAPSQLSFARGDSILVITKDPSGWWKGVLRGRVALFPKNFVEELPFTPAPAAAAAAPAAQPAQQQQQQQQQQQPSPAANGTTPRSDVAPQTPPALAANSTLLKPHNDAPTGAGNVTVGHTATPTPAASRPGAAAAVLADESFVPDKAIAQYDYTAQKASQLSFKKGDVILVIDKDKTGWWKGELDGRIARFPSNFTKYVPGDGLAKPSEAARKSRKETLKAAKSKTDVTAPEDTDTSTGGTTASAAAAEQERLRQQREQAAKQKQQEDAAAAAAAAKRQEAEAKARAAGTASPASPGSADEEDGELNPTTFIGTHRKTAGPNEQKSPRQQAPQQQQQQQQQSARSVQAGAPTQQLADDEEAPPPPSEPDAPKKMYTDKTRPDVAMANAIGAELMRARSPDSTRGSQAVPAARVEAERKAAADAAAVKAEAERKRAADAAAAAAEAERKRAADAAAKAEADRQAAAAAAARAEAERKALEEKRLAADRKAAEDRLAAERSAKAEADRRAAEARAAAERKAAEERAAKAEADQRAAEARAAAERKVAEERAARAAEVERQAAAERKAAAERAASRSARLCQSPRRCTTRRARF
jgi:hypothetical protein